MHACPYIQPADYQTYGIADATAAQVHIASRFVDSYLGRPEGLLWSADANGQPAWMTGLTASRVYKLQQDVPPGSNLQIIVPYASFGFQAVGDVVILDRGNRDLAEACVVTAASGNTLTLENVQFAHSAQATMEFGLTILHETRINQTARRVIRITRSPLAQVLSGFGRFIYEPRGSHMSRPGFSPLALAELALGGSPPAWTEFSLSDCDINYETGVITLFAGLPQSGFSEVRIRYIAGWQYATLPEAIKRAVAGLVRNAIDTSDLPGNVRMVKAGDGAMEKFRDSVLDADTNNLLAPYRTLRI